MDLILILTGEMVGKFSLFLYENVNLESFPIIPISNRYLNNKSKSRRCFEGSGIGPKVLGNVNGSWLSLSICCSRNYLSSRYVGHSSNVRTIVSKLPQLSPTFFDYFSFAASHTRPVSGAVVTATNGAAVKSLFMARASSARIQRRRRIGSAQ